MKIALVCDWYAPRVGGIESYLRDLGRHLRGQGHLAHVITATPGPAHVEGLRVHRLAQTRLPGWDVIWSPSTVAEGRRILVEERFDVVHAHSLYSPLTHVSMYLSHSLGIPGVLTSHSLLSPGGVL